MSSAKFWKPFYSTKRAERGSHKMTDSSINFFTSFHLKLTALICMIIDHIGYTMPLGRLVSPMRAIGRTAFPLYAFMAAEGCRRTRNREHYLFRLGLLALVSEIPFDLAFNGGDINFFSRTNVFYTLLFAVASVHIYETLHRRNHAFQMLAIGYFGAFIAFCLLMVQFVTGGSAYPVIMMIFLYLAGLLAGCRYLQTYEENSTENFVSNVLSFLPLLPVLALSVFIGCDYELFGVLLILCIYIAGTRRRQIAVLCAGVVYEYGLSPVLDTLRYEGAYIDMGTMPRLGFALISVLLVMFYNGRRGKNVKWAFYWAYPIHIAILAALSRLFFR